VVTVEIPVPASESILKVVDGSCDGAVVGLDDWKIASLSAEYNPKCNLLPVGSAIRKYLGSVAYQVDFHNYCTSYIETVLTSIMVDLDASGYYETLFKRELVEEATINCELYLSTTLGYRRLGINNYYGLFHIFAASVLIALCLLVYKGIQDKYFPGKKMHIYLHRLRRQFFSKMNIQLHTEEEIMRDNDFAYRIRKILREELSLYCRKFTGKFKPILLKATGTMSRGFVPEVDDDGYSSDSRDNESDDVIAAQIDMIRLKTSAKYRNVSVKSKQSNHSGEFHDLMLELPSNRTVFYGFNPQSRVMKRPVTQKFQRVNSQTFSEKMQQLSESHKGKLNSPTMRVLTSSSKAFGKSSLRAASGRYRSKSISSADVEE
jgi:hypothetical protein